MTLHVEVAGSGSRIVLLVHGQPGSAADWAGVARALSPRFRVLVPDRPGYGHSAGPAVSIAANADTLAALLEEHGVGRALVAGHSWGTAVAVALAERHPERVESLVLVCPVTPDEHLGPADRALADRRAAPLVRAGFWIAGTALATAPAQGALARALPGFDGRRARETADQWRRGPTWRSFLVEQCALLDELPRLRDGLAGLRAPTTVVVGRRDRVTDPEAGRRLAAALGARLVEVDRGGHMLPMRSPGRVAEAIAEASVPSTRP